MNIAIIFAGGKGTRMGKTEKPKQFLEFCKMPVIIHTIKAFQNSNDIDKIIIVTLEDWIEYLEDLIKKYNLFKVDKIVKGGETGQLSIYAGIKYAYENYDKNSIVLINDGVRPFIDKKLINENIDNVKKYGSAISIVYATETVALLDNRKAVKQIPNRDNCVFVKAPQSFYLKDIYEVHQRAKEDKIFNFVDSATLMNYYGKKLSTVLTNYDNIKITTPKDIVLAESIYKRFNN